MDLALDPSTASIPGPLGDEGFFRRVFFEAPVAMALVDTDLRLVEVNAEMERLLGRSAGDLIGESVAVLGRESDASASVLAAAADALAQDGVSERVEHSFHRVDGTGGWARTVLRRVDRPGHHPVLVCNTEDLTSGRLALEQQRREAELDSLTGLLNRRGGDRRLGAALERVQSTGPLAVILCDADGFKGINDEHGHPAGDVVLVSLANRLRGILRSGDEVIRLGGDEFLVLARVGGEEEAAAVAERCVRVADSPIALGAASCRLTMSAGVAVVAPADGAVEPSAAMLAADRALYRAKDLGRNRWEMHAGGYDGGQG